MNDVKKKTNSEEVLNHWLGFADEFTLAPQEFYAAVEKELETLKIPGLEISREEYAEGGMLSAKRVYFRMIRERLAFDVCTWQFSTTLLFLVPHSVFPDNGQILACARGHRAFLRHLLWDGHSWASNLVSLPLLASWSQLPRHYNVVAMRFSNLDSFLLKVPAVGPIYERVFRKERITASTRASRIWTPFPISLRNWLSTSRGTKELNWCGNTR